MRTRNFDIFYTFFVPFGWNSAQEITTRNVMSDFSDSVKIGAMSDAHYLTVQTNFYPCFPRVLSDLGAIRYERSVHNSAEQWCLVTMGAGKEGLFL